MARGDIPSLTIFRCEPRVRYYCSQYSIIRMDGKSCLLASLVGGAQGPVRGRLHIENFVQGIKEILGTSAKTANRS